MPLIFLLFLTFFNFSTPCFAGEIELVDQGARLAALPGRHRENSFASAFTCGQPTSFFVRTGQCKLHCEFGLCEEQCGWPSIVEAQFQPEDCQADSVAIYSSLGHSILATATDYAASSDSIALTIIKSVSLFYDAVEKIQIDQVLYPMRKNLIENGQMKQISLTVIALSIFPDKNKTESQGLMLSLDLSQSGLNQLMCLASNNTCETNQDYIIKRKGLVNASY